MRKNHAFLIIFFLTIYSFGQFQTAPNSDTVEINNSDIYNLNSSKAKFVWSLPVVANSKSKNSENSYSKQEISKNTVSDNRLKIRLEYTTTTNFHREILLTIDDRTTNGYDKGFDAVLGDAHPNDMYWMLDDDKLVIQAIKELPIDRVVRLGIKSFGDCTAKIKLDTIENPYPDMQIFIRDNSTMETFDIKNEAFELTLEEGEFNDKYALVFEPKVEITVEEEVTFDQALIFVGGQNRSLSIRKPKEMMINNISMFNEIGQQIKTWNTDLNESQMELPIHFETGVYIVHMETSTGKLQKKVIIR